MIRNKLSLLLLWMLALSLTAPSSALAIGVLFDGPSGYGTSASSAEDAFDAGIPMLEASQLLGASNIGVTIPAPSDINAALVSSPSSSNPNTATSTWTVNRDGESAGEDIWLVFTNPTPDPATETDYSAGDVGIDLQETDWGLLVLQASFEGSLRDFYYPAVHVGAGSSVTFLMHHIVNVDLAQFGNDLVLPRYSVAVVVDPGIVVPEPAAAGLVLLGLGAVALRRKRAR